MDYEKIYILFYLFIFFFLLIILEKIIQTIERAHQLTDIWTIQYNQRLNEKDTCNQFLT